MDGDAGVDTQSRHAEVKRAFLGEVARNAYQLLHYACIIGCAPDAGRTRRAAAGAGGRERASPRLEPWRGA